VEVLHGGRLQRFGAGRISLCAGAIHTPALLLRSGIGDAAECRRLGAEPVAHLPGVGQGLMDHPAVVLWLRPTEPAGAAAPQAVHQLLARACSGIDGGPDAEPDLTLFMLSHFPTAHTPRLEAMLGTPQAHGISVMLARPASQGQVRLRSAAPQEPPRIELGLGSAPQDVERLMAGLRLAWRIAHAAPLASHARSIFLWREATLASDPLLRSAVQRQMTGTWHAAGTARMGPRPEAGAVVDEHFSVHGVAGLRVVDASVMPVLPSVPTALACMMLGERAAACDAPGWRRPPKG
jgi:choline dehydrogenase